MGRDKIQLGLHVISYSKGKAKPKYEREQRIQRGLEETNRLFENDPSLRLDDIKEKLQLLREEKVKGIVIRARARWHEYDERVLNTF